MLFHPAAIALLLIDGVGLLLLIPSAWFAVRLLRDWELASGSARQIRLERRTSLISTLLAFLFAAQIVALLLFVFTADSLAPQFAGAMCAVGTLNVNPWGFPALYLKLALFFLMAGWLLMHAVDSRAPDYPLIRARYALLLTILPLALADAAAQILFFLDLRADLITSCCGSLFDREGRAVASELAALPPRLAIPAVHATLGGAMLAGIVALRRQKGGSLFALLGTLAFPVTIVGVVAFVAPYLYEHPNHHCPFCLLKAEYHYFGYLLYLPLFTAAALAFGVGITRPFLRAAGSSPILRRAMATSTGLFAFCMALIAWVSLRSHLVLLE